MDTSQVLSVETTAPVIEKLGCQVKAPQRVIGVSSQMGQKDSKHKLT